MMIISPIDPAWRDWIQTLSWIGTVIGIAVATLKYISEQHQNREQQERELEQSKLELRWKQAEAAKKLLDEMLTDPDAGNAMRMLDWADTEFEVKPGLRLLIGEEDYVKALRISDFDFDDKELYIRDSFDSLFYYMAMIEHYIQSDLVRLEDVLFPLDYYVRIMNNNRPVFDTFLNYYGLTRAKQFMQRLDKHEMEAPADARAVEAMPTDNAPGPGAQ
ncbi:MAG TPA: hypothetical protein VF717_18195 [Pyrinomonadaceae bacterium]|jgi:hypothetical protein